MTSNAFVAQGTLLKRGDGGSPEVFTSIGEITDFSGPGGKAKIIDVTNLDSTAIEKLVGLPDEGTLTITLTWDPENAQHTGLRSDRAARVKRNFQMVFSDSGHATAAFAAFVLGYTIAGKVDDKVTAKVDLEITGPIAWS